MSGSSLRVNYYLRPSKCVERKMLREVISKMSGFEDIKKYRYIGFGAKYFTDFILFHKEFGICKMISIECEENKPESYEFNKPLRCIDIEFGQASAVLNRIFWQSIQKDIIWLDYDNSITSQMLFDFKNAIIKASSGSLIVFSCNSSCRQDGIENKEQYLQNYCKETLSFNIDKKDLSRNRIHRVIKQMYDNIVKEALYEKNALNSKYVFKQLIYFKYSDGAPMITIGGILIREEDEAVFDKCGFNQLNYISQNDEPFEIESPKLTYKEIQEVNKYLPIDDITTIDLPFLPKDKILIKKERENINNYVKLYRYFPYYMEVQSFN
ncbi:MAG: O-methyltransferase [Ignavibacteriales bacterium]